MKQNFYNFSKMFLELKKTYNPHSALSYDNKVKPVYSILAEVTLVRYLGGDFSLSDSCILIAPKIRNFAS